MTGFNQAGAKVSRRSVLAGGVAASLALTFSVKRAAAADFEFRLGHPLQPTDATQTAMLSYADAVKERSGGRVAIEVFPADQLGVQKEVGEMLVQGANVMQFTDYLFMAEWVPDAGILQAPFLLNELDDWYKLAKSDWMKSLEAKLQEKNVRVLSNNNYFGSRSIIGPKAIRKPEDIKGETIREAAAPMYIAMAEAWGARPVVMGFAETYTGLSQGVVDFVECPPQAMVSSKFTELRKVVSLTAHMANWNPVIVSQSAFAELPEDLQQILTEEAMKAGDLVTKLKKEDDAKINQALKDMGIEVVTDIDKAAFQKASLPAYESFKDWTPGLTETVRGVLDS